ncbi:hypothetical protein KKG66_09570, partial [bacterium]|nr:hypothetical protein [bacterium]
GEFGAKVGDCGFCHTMQANTFAGRVPGHAEAIPAMMYEGEVGCTDCHAIKNNHVSRDVVQACIIAMMMTTRPHLLIGSSSAIHS